MISRQFSSSQSQSSRVLETQLTQEERFNQKLVEAEELVQNDQVDQAIDQLRLLMEKINFMKQNKKEYDKKLELICLYNLAAAYQKQWSLDQCMPLLQKFIALVKINLQQNLKSSGTINPHQVPVHKHWFKLKTVLVRSMLQYCAILSQIGQHKKALKTATEITSEIRTLFRRGLEECQKQIAKKEAAQAKKKLGKQGKTGVDKIQFSFSVLLSARDILQDLSKMLTYSEIIDKKQIQEEMQQVKSNIYYWKSIPQNNIKTLRQSFTSEDPEQIKRKNERNLLGIKRNQDWIEQFTIAKVMFMSPINYLQFCDNDNLIFEFNHRNIVEKIFLLSVAYFSLSIELRFLQQENNFEKKKGKNDKKQKENREINELQRSEIFHLKSIEVVCKHIKQNSSFVNHLVFNYHKHYKNNLNTIEEQNSIAQYSELYQVKFQNKNNSNTEDQQIVQSSNFLVLPSSKRFRKDSIYYEEEPVHPTSSKKTVKQASPVMSFKKSKKKIGLTHEQKVQRQSKLKSSTSFSKYEDIGSKDRTLKKMGSAKIITVGKFDLHNIDKHDKSQSYKQISLRNIKDKSLSKSKNFLKSSVTLKHNKTSSPTKERRSKQKHFRDLKESGEERKDFTKKKSPEGPKPLDLLKKSGSLHQFSGKNLKESGSLYTNALHMKKKK